MPKQSEQSEKKATAQGRKPGLALFAATLLIGGIWGIVLPRLAEVPTLQEKINHLDQKGIDPAAFFYTDHPNVFDDK